MLSTIVDWIQLNIDLILKLGLLYLVISVARNIRPTIDKYFSLKSDKLLFDKPYGDVIGYVDILNSLILERFELYCVKNIEHQKDFIMNSESENIMIKEVSEDVLKYLSKNVVAIISMYLEVTNLAEYITDKVIVLATEYSIKLNTQKNKEEIV